MTPANIDDGEQFLLRQVVKLIEGLENEITNFKKELDQYTTKCKALLLEEAGDS